MLQRGDSTGQVHFERESVFVHSDANADLHILHYPHPDTNMHTLWHLTSLDAYDYVPHIGVLATAREQGACTEVCLYAIHSDRVRRTNMIRVQRTGVECMSVYGYNGIVALGGERVVDVSWFPNVSGIGRPWPSSRCVLASDVTSVRVRDNTHPCVIGMRSGVVVCRDFSYELKEQSSFSCGRNRSIVDIQLSDRNDTYVSCAGNGRDNLALWDLRTPGRAAAVGFVGHKNAYKKLQFDVDGECGLVAAGGDDGMVRLWDRRWGGVPMGEIFVGGFVEEVRLVGWSQGLGGMWVRNQSDVYVLDCRGG